MRALEVTDVWLLIWSFVVVFPVVCGIELGRDALRRRRAERMVAGYLDETTEEWRG